MTSLFDKLALLFRADPAAPSRPAAPTGKSANTGADEDIPRYPPFQKGLPACGVDRLLATQQMLVDNIRHTVGLEYKDFDRLILPVLKRYAEFVHLLPASEKHHHRGAGGLLRHGLEVAFWAARASEGVLFVAGGTPLERRELEPRWHVAACLAGLLHDLGKAVCNVDVVSRDGTSIWDPFKETIVEWATASKIDRYYIYWRKGRHQHHHEALSPAVAARVLTPEIYNWLAFPQREIIIELHVAITNTSAETPIAQLVKSADEHSTSKDMKEARYEYPDDWGVPVERYILDAMARLVSSGEWKVNERGARVWATDQGLFVAWKQGAKEVTDLLYKDRIPGIPNDPRILADILLERDLALPFVARDRTRFPYWRVAPEPLRTADGGKVILEMIRLAGAHNLLSTSPPTLVNAEVVDESATVQRVPDPVKELLSKNDADNVVSINRKQDKPNPSPGDKPEKKPAKPPAKQNGTGNEAKPDSGQRTLVIGSLGETDKKTETPPKPEAGEHGASKEPSEAKHLLSAMINDVQTGKYHWGQTLIRINDVVVVSYPDGASHYGAPATVLSIFLEAGWIDVDPLRPNQKVREVNGVRGLVLVPRISAQALAQARDTSTTAPKPKQEDHKPKPAVINQPPAATDNITSAANDLLRLVCSGSADIPFLVTDSANGYKIVTKKIVGWYADKTGDAVTPPELLLALSKMASVNLTKDNLYVQIAPFSPSSATNDS